MTVNKARVKLLVDALRSGEFEQGNGYLTTAGGKNCCLGVGCIVAVRSGLNLATDVCSDGTIAYYDSTLRSQHEDYSNTYLPRVVMEWYGFESVSPTLKVTPEVADALVADGRIHEDAYERARAHRGEPINAADCNDDLRMTFLEIADAFERTYLVDEPEVPAHVDEFIENPETGVRRERPSTS